jgi:hypothetical protein
MNLVLRIVGVVPLVWSVLKDVASAISAWHNPPPVESSTDDTHKEG